MLRTALLIPCPHHLSFREKTFCTASRWPPHSQHSPRVSRSHPTIPGGSPLPGHPPHSHPACPPVTQCRTEGSTRGLAAVPRLALDVMACEVLRVLQLTDTALVPVSFLVPRKVRSPCGWHCLKGAWCHLTGHTSPALGDKKDVAAVRPQSPAWEQQEWRSNLGADGGLQSLGTGFGKPGAACRIGVLERGC